MIKDYFTKSVKDAEFIMSDPLAALQLLEWLLIGHILVISFFIYASSLWTSWPYYLGILITLINGFMLAKKYSFIRKNYGDLINE